MGYRIVIIPPSVNIRSSTLELLKSFTSAGGTVFIVGSMPHLVDGKPSEEARWFLSEHAHRVDGAERFDYSEIIESISDANGRTVVVRNIDGTDTPQLKVNRRIWNGCEILYLANVSRDHITASVTFDFAVNGVIEEWDLSTGTTTPFAPCSISEPCIHQVSWHPRQARAFVAVPRSVDMPPPRKWQEARRLQPSWTGKRTEPNALLLDTVIRVKGDMSQPTQSISDAQNDLSKRNASDTTKPITFEYPFEVNAEAIPTGNLRIAGEFEGNSKITLNDHPASPLPNTWFLDPAIRVVGAERVVRDNNTLRITGVFEQPESLQSAFLLGDFDVATSDDVHFAITAPRERIPIGPWPEVGLPFYAGTVVYTTVIDLRSEAGSRIILDLPGLVGAAEIRVNGAIVDHILWPPYSCDISANTHDGENVIEIEVANTLRNLLGAHYNYNEETQAGISIASYSAPYGAKKQFKAYGMLSAPEIVIERAE